MNQRASLEDLIDAWWKSAEAMEAKPPVDSSLADWHALVFEKILVQCGWTVTEWNVAVDALNSTRKES